jgi:drug/metabolite transporter (DMT)-like permease
VNNGTALKKQYYIHGVLPILMASVLWALAYFARKIILHDITPLTLTFLTALITAIFLTLVLRPNPKNLWITFKAQKLKFIALALSGVVLGTTCMYIALDNLDLGLATVLEKLQPIFTLFLAAYFLREKLPRKILPYCVLAIISSVFIFNGTHTLETEITAQSFIGITAVLATAFFWATSGVLGRSLVLGGAPSRDVALLRFLLGSIFLLPLFLLQAPLDQSLVFLPLTWSVVIASAVFSTGCGYLLYYKGLGFVDASTSSFLELLTPVISVILGIAFLHETLSGIQVFFIGLLLFSIYKITTAKK